TWVISRRPEGVTRLRNRSSRSARLRSAGIEGSDRVHSSRACPWTIRPNRNSSSSRSSSRPCPSASATVATTPNRSSTSARSRGRAHLASAAATAVSSAAAHTLPSSSTRMICAFCSAGRVGSATARRSPCSRSSRSAIANRSSASVPKSAEPAALLNRSSTSASEVLLTPLIGRSPSPSRGPGPGRTPGRTLRSRHRSSADRPRVGRGGGLQLLEEPVDDAALPRLVLEGLADDAAGQLDGQPTDLRAELGEGGLAIRLDLGLRRLDDAASLGLGLLAELGLDLRALRLRLLADPGRLLP